MFELHFENPNAVLVGKERKSKLLAHNSSLYAEASRQRQILESTFGSLVDAKRMDFHVELIKDNPTDNLLVERAQLVEGTPINTTVYNKTGKSIGFIGPYVSGYGQTHITLGYFPAGLPVATYEILLH